jgi:hypothetical protein
MRVNRMMTKKTIGIYSAIRQGFCLYALCAFAMGPVPGWSQESEAYQRAERRFVNGGSVADAIKKVKEGNFGGVTVEEIVYAGAVEAIPALKEQFARSVDPSNKDDLDPGNKEELASALIRLGDKDEIYWDFLLKQATEAVDSDPPFPRDFDPKGKILKDHFSGAFLNWAKGRGLSPDEAGEIAVYRLPIKLGFLAKTGDPRGLPLLRRAMSSSNYMIATMAAKGLAKLQDKDSIPLIIAACQKSPGGSGAIAEALIFFDDPDAQAAADVYLPRDYANGLRERRKVPGNDAFLY